MGERAAALADQFEGALSELVTTIEGCSDEQWRAMCSQEGWTVAATAQHVGAQFPLERQYISAAAEGRPLPALTWDTINTTNENRAANVASCSKEEALSLLRDGGASMAAYVRGLTDEQLDRTGALPLAGGAMVSTQALIEGGVLIDHVRGHMASIRSAG